MWILAGGVAGALFYALLAGFSVPTQRSVLMLAAFAWAWWRGSGGSGWTAWWQALAVVLLLDPLAVLGVGTWLSFGLVDALIWASSGRLKESGWRFGCTGAMGGDGIVGGIAGLFVCFVTFAQSLG